jgi:hypothetical protein
MIIVCERCEKKGLLDGHPYLGKRLRLKCPYCTETFVFTVPLNGDDLASAVVEEGSEPLLSRGYETVSSPADATPVSEASEEVISEAKRIARLIVSEIKLYNQDKISKASSKKEIMELLRMDLMKGKEHYNGRIASRLSGGPDYFMDTVKEILLAGKD